MKTFVGTFSIAVLSQMMSASLPNARLVSHVFHTDDPSAEDNLDIVFSQNVDQIWQIGGAYIQVLGIQGLLQGGIATQEIHTK